MIHKNCLDRIRYPTDPNRPMELTRFLLLPTLCPPSLIGSQTLRLRRTDFVFILASVDFHSNLWFLQYWNMLPFSSSLKVLRHPLINSTLDWNHGGVNLPINHIVALSQFNICWTSFIKFMSRLNLDLSI